MWPQMAELGGSICIGGRSMMGGRRGVNTGFWLGGVSRGPSRPCLSLWAVRGFGGLLGRSRVCRGSHGGLAGSFLPGDAAGLCPGPWRARVSDHRAGGNRSGLNPAGRTEQHGWALPWASGLTGQKAGSVGYWGCPGTSNRKSLGGRKPWWSQAPDAADGCQQEAALWAAQGRQASPAWGCRPRLGATAAEPHGLLGPQHAFPQAVTRQESHVLD